MVLQHLLEMRDAPVLRRRIAEEPAFDVVVRASSGHMFQRVDRHLMELGIGAKLGLLEEQQDRVGLRELRRVAEPAVPRIVGRGHRFEDRIDQPSVELARAARDSGAGTLARLQHARRDLGLVGPVIGRDLAEGVRHLVRRQVRGPGEDVAGGSQERGRRPPAHVVALVDVRADVVVDPDGHVIAVDEVDDPGVRVGGLVHDMAPVAPDG